MKKKSHSIIAIHQSFLIFLLLLSVLYYIFLFKRQFFIKKQFFIKTHISNRFISQSSLGWDYGINWLSFFSLIPLYPINFSNVPKCHQPNLNLSFSGISTSTIKDCLLTSYFKKVYGLFPLIRTFRTVGSKATVVLFLDDPAYHNISDTGLKIINLCSVAIVDIGNPLEKIKNSDSLKFITHFRLLL